MSADIQKALEDRTKVMEHLRAVMSSDGFRRTEEGIHALMTRLRTEGGVQREEFVIAGLVAIVSLDTSDDLSPARFGRFMRVLASVWEVVVTARIDAERAAFAQAGEVRA
jgi:hypothetical protein